MSKTSGTLNFEVAANLQRLIGRELVPNDEMALVELVKNAYDSGATRVRVTIDPGDQSHRGFIEVRDNGSGMSLADIKQSFMFVGYSHRPEELKSARRVPTGEKGLGRFAADKLGKDLTVTTRERGSATGLKIHIDWDEFERHKTKRFSEIDAEYKTVPARELGDLESGTVLRIERLRSAWPRPRIEALRHGLGELLNPFHSPSNFQVELQVENSPKLSGPIVQKAPDLSDIEVTFSIGKDGKLSRVLRMYGKQKGPTEQPDSKVGLRALSGLKGTFLYSEKRLPKAKAHGLTPGVRLYRDGFRVEPIGSPAADWLGVSEKRAKRAGHAHIVPSRLFGFVEIHRKENPDLVDTTSRQALLDSDSALTLVTVLREQLSYLEETIRTHVAEPRWRENRKRQAVEFEQAKLQTLGVLSFGLAHEIRQPLQSIRSEAHNIGVRLGQLGISDPDVAGAQRSIDRNIERVDKNIELISAISRGTIDEASACDFADLVKAECALFSTRCSALGIDLRINTPEKQPAVLSRTAVSTVLLNLVKNSIESIESRREDKPGHSGVINVTLTETRGVHILKVSDNGAGVASEVVPKLFKKFTTKKTAGTGVGLYYCKTVLEAFGGAIDLTTNGGSGAEFTVKMPNSTERT